MSKTKSGYTYDDSFFEKHVYPNRLTFSNKSYIEPIDITCWKEFPKEVNCYICNRLYNRLEGNYSYDDQCNNIFICPSKQCVNTYIFQNL
jgi:hypothetical protein